MTGLAQRRAGARNGAALAEQAIADGKAEAARRKQEDRQRLDVEIADQRIWDATCAAEITDEQLHSARFVRLAGERVWLTVVRVNAKSITLDPPGPWPRFRVPLSRVCEVRR